MVNYIAVLVASIVAYFIGFLWYSDFLFGKLWRKLSNKNSSSDMKMNGWIIGLGFVSTLVLVYVLAFFMGVLSFSGYPDVLLVAGLLWLGFIATIMFNSVLYDKAPFKVFLINALHYLVVLVVSAIILYVWA